MIFQKFFMLGKIIHRELLIVKICLISLIFSVKCVSQQRLLMESYVRSSYIARGFIGTATPTAEGSLTYAVSPKYRVNLWGISSLTKKYSEIDLTMEYQYKSFILSLIDYYNPSANESFNYFDLKDYNTAHTLDLIIFYRFGNSFPLGIKLSSYLLGCDFDPLTKKRMYSTYMEFSYLVSYNRLNFSPYMGFVPWKSWYSDEFSIVNCGIRFDSDLLCSERTCMPATFNFIYNPRLEQLNLNLILGFQLISKSGDCCYN